MDIPRKNNAFVRSAASAPFGGDWWRATNRILQGCPVLVILVNALMGVWKAELDSLREQVVVVTKNLPPCKTLAADDSTSVVLEWQGPGRADIGAGGYVNDTEVVAPSAAALRRTVPATEKWLQLTGQDVNAGKSTVWTLDSDAGEPIKLLGVPMVALQGVQLADTADVDPARLETQTFRAIWGPTKPSKAKEVVFSLLTPGHCTPPTMRTKYERLVWMAQLARVPGAAQVLMEAILECRDAPLLHGPAGRAVRTARALGWTPLGVWWRWRVPGQGEPLDRVAED